MIQLRATYDGQIYDLDLYDESPIKLNLSVEDITNADATSTYSRTFRVPANRNNNKFFKHAFEINGIDYDVTIKKPADIMVDGALFKTGHVRLQKIYTNGAEQYSDYELLFLGETRDFASVLGDARMCQLDIPSLDGTPTATNVVDSWQAYPQGGSTAGYKSGDVIFPLIDHGSTYDTGNISDSQINLTNSVESFVKNGWPISYDRFKPMIRMRLLFEKIFTNNGFTINFPLLQTDRFRHIYVSAFGNEAIPYVVFDDTYTIGFNVEDANWFDPSGTGPQKINWFVEQLDPGNNFDITNDWYTVPLNANGSTISFQSRISWENTHTGSGTYELRLYKVGQTAPVASTPFFVDSTFNPGGSGTTSVSATVTGVTGAQYYVAIAYISGNASIIPGTTTQTDYFKTTSISAGAYNPVNDLDCDYKQIDFIKDILTTFRLVMEPDIHVPRQFNIKPFDQYITSGSTYDWSTKLDRSKDVTLEPLFNTQSDQIEFKFTEEGDWVNDYHQKAYKRVYGRALFDSGNDLLIGKREIKASFGSTEVTQIEGTGAGASDPKTWVLAQIHTHGGDGKHEPIKAKTRLLFYNGIKSVSQYATWHFSTNLSTTPHQSATQVTKTEYPLVTAYEAFPPLNNSLILNFDRDFAYWYDGTAGGYNSGESLNGVSLYSAYWQNYISSLYNKFARRVTGNFILNYDDLKDFTFDDVVFVDNAYYRVEKIIDATLAETAPTKVQLIKLNDYDPNALPSGVINVTLTPTDTTCYGDSDGSLEVVYAGGAAPYTYSINGGSPVTAPASPFTITGLSAGNYTVTVTDANSATGQDTEVIADGNPQLFLNVSTRGIGGCGETAPATYTASGGTAPYYITGVFQSYAGVAQVTETNIPAGSYIISVTDAAGCTVTQPLNMTEPAYCVDDNLITDIRQMDIQIGCEEQGVGCTPESGTCVIVTVGSGVNAGKYAWLGNTWSDFTSTYPTGTLVDIFQTTQVNCNGDWVKFNVTENYDYIAFYGICYNCDVCSPQISYPTDYTSQKANWNWRV